MIALILVFVACCGNVIFLEHIIKECSQSANLISASQFLFIAIEGFIFTSKFGTKAPVVPLRQYFILVTMFLVVSVAGNYAHTYNIPMPLQMIFRSGSLVSSMMMGIIILKKTYKLSKYIAVLIITCGIAICTIASSKEKSQLSEKVNDESHVSEWTLGLLLLTFSILLAARMGVYQETICSKFGRHPREALFYCHALPLPGFILLGKDIYSSIVEFNQSEPFLLPVVGAVPKLWIYLLCNVMTQYVCIRSVFVLTTQYSSLSVTLVVTLRKFVSLIMSIFYFQNPFTLSHWIGTFLVFIGTMLFIDIMAIVRKQYRKFGMKQD